MIPVFEVDNTVLFTWTASVAPDSAPIFKVTDTVNDTVITSITALQSSSTEYYVPFTMPGSEGLFVGEWRALKTLVSSAYPFVKRFQFRTTQTKAPD